MKVIHLKTLFILLAVFLLPVSTVEAEKKYNTDVRYLYVQPGQTLYNILTKVYPEQKKDWERIKDELVRLNPHAFTSGTATSLKANVKLRLPDNTNIRKPAKMTAHVGDVVLTRGKVIAISSQDIKRTIIKGDPIYIGDKLITGENGFLRMRMIDKALLDLRCYSVLVIESYNLQDTNRVSILNLLQGSLHNISGDIGKSLDDVYELKTPVATVGVRGTEYALRVYQSKGCDGTVNVGDNGLYVKVIDGLVNVNNKAGSTPVVKGNTVYIPVADVKPVPKKIKKGVFAPVATKDVVKNVEVVENIKVEKETSDTLWWVLAGVIILALVL